MTEEERRKLFRGRITTKVDFCSVAQEVIQEIPLYYDENQIWYKWNTEMYKWEKTDETDILLNIREELEVANITQPGIKGQLLSALQIMARKNKPKDLQPTQVQFKDQIIDIITGKTEKATQKHFTFNPIQWKLGNTESTPVIDKFLSEWVGTEQAIILKEWIAYHLLTSYPIHRICCMTGAGRNGKSTCVQLMQKFLGKDNTTAGDFETVLSVFQCSC